MIGSKLSNRYELTRVLGRGGMGIVYLAHDHVLDRDVAVKLIAPSLLSEEIEQRFTREARVVAKMDHPSIVGVYDFGAHEGSLFFVMPFVPGTNLRAFLRAEPVRLGDAIDVAIQAASALDYSHSLGVVHRDIKPENMMIVRDGDALRVRVTDFGLAFTAKDNRITRTGSLMGSVSYFSPEQVAGRTVDPRSDIYSLGIVIYECLVGAPPFVGDMHSVLYRIVNEMITPARTMAPNVPADLDAIVMQCVAKNPAERPQRARDIADQLAKLRSRLDDGQRALIVADTVVTSGPPAAQQPRQPLVGREKEYGELQKRLAAAMAGEGQLVVVSGEAGIGKTRLLDALEALAGVKGVPVLRSSFAEVHQAFPYQAFYDLIHVHLRAAASASTDLADLMPDLLQLFPALADLESVRSAISAVSRPPVTHDQAYLYDLLARTFARIGGGKPLILMLDDLHASTMSLDALQYIVLRLGTTPTLIVGAYTDTGVDKAHPLTKLLDAMKGSRRFTGVPLGRFTPSEHRLFVENIVGSSRLDPALVQQLHATAEGNPYVAKEILRALLDAGSITKDATGEWSLSLDREISAEDLPATLQEAVEKRLERLGDEPKQVLTLASVLGRSFDMRDLETIADGVDDLDPAIDALLVGGFLEEERTSRGDRLAFTSGVVCDAVYKAMPRRKKRSAHLAAAEAIEARAKGRLERVYAQLLHHYVRADATEKVRDLGLKQARHALASLLVDDAIEAAKSVLTFLDDEGDADAALEAETRTVLAAAYRMKGNHETALKETEAAIKILESGGDPAARLAAIVTAAETAWDARRVHDVRRWIERGLAAATSLDDRASLRRLLLLGTTIANLRGEFEVARGLQAQLAALAKAPERPGEPEALPRGGTLRVGFTVEARATQPADVARDVEVEILSNVFETLIATDAYGQLAPGLCSHWEAQNGNTTFVLALRRDVRFHDGTPLTAADVKATLDVPPEATDVPTLVLPHREATQAEAPVRRVTIVDDHTVRVELPEPLPIFPALLTAPQFAIARGSLGTGPFTLADAEHGLYRLVRNDGYHGTPPRLDALEIRSGLTTAQLATALRAGELDLAGDLTARDLDELVRDRRRGLALVETTKKNICYAVFNTHTGRCATAALREVLVESVRPNELVWQTIGRFGQPALGLIPPGILGHDAGRRRATITRDQAIERLTTAGVAFPILLRAAVHPVLLDRYRSITDALFAAWAEVGISVVIGTHDMSSFLQAFDDPDRFDVIFSRYIADYDDPDSFTYAFFHGTAGSQRQFWNDPDFDQITEEARAESHAPAREKLYRRAESLVLAKHVVLPLFHEVDCRLASPQLRNVQLRAVPPYANYAELAKVEHAPVRGERPRGGIIAIPMHHKAQTFDPASSSYNWLDDMLRLVFEPLTLVTEGEGIGPGLATEFHGEDGGRRFRFVLRDGVRFHDGRRLTSRDVRASWERVLSEDNDQRPLLFPIVGARALARGEAKTLAGFEIVSPTEFSVALEQPLAMFPALAATVVSCTVPEQGFRPSCSWRDGCVGTGPYRVVRFEPGRALELEANPYHWSAAQHRAETLIFTFDVPRTQIATELEEGRATMVMDLPAADVARLRAHATFAKGYHAVSTLSTLALFLNTRRGPFADEAVRHELAAALDIAGLVRRNANGLASPARSYTPLGFLGHEPRPPKPRAAFPPRTEPIDLVALSTANGLDLWGGLVRELTETLGARGFRLKFTPMTVSPHAAAARGDCDLMLVTWGADYPDADGMLHGSLVTEDGAFGGMVANAEVDRLLVEARRELDPAARQSLYRSVESLIVERALLVPLLHKHNHAFVAPGVRGGDRTVAMIGYNFEHLWSDA